MLCEDNIKVGEFFEFFRVCWWWWRFFTFRFFLVGRDWKAEKSLFRYNMYISAQYKQFFLCVVPKNVLFEIQSKKIYPLGVHL